MTNNLFNQLILIIPIIIFSIILTWFILKKRTGILGTRYKGNEKKFIRVFKVLIFIFYIITFIIALIREGGIYLTIDSIEFIITNDTITLLLIIPTLFFSCLTFPRDTCIEKIKLFVLYVFMFIGLVLFISSPFPLTYYVIQSLVHIYILAITFYSIPAAFLS